MCRIIAGTLIEVGYGLRTDDSVARLFTERNRRLAGPTMPPEGLCMDHVEYNHQHQNHHLYPASDDDECANSKDDLS